MPVQILTLSFKIKTWTNLMFACKIGKYNSIPICSIVITAQKKTLFGKGFYDPPVIWNYYEKRS